MRYRERPRAGVSEPWVFGSMRYSHSNVMIGGGAIIHTCAGRVAVRRRQCSQPSRQYCTPSSTLPEPLQRATSLASRRTRGPVATTGCAGRCAVSGVSFMVRVFRQPARHISDVSQTRPLHVLHYAWRGQNAANRKYGE